MLGIRNIGELLLVPKGPVPGRTMRNVERLPDAALLIDGEKIIWIGLDRDFDAPAGAEVLDAHGGCVVPGLIDAHTHTVFAGTREDEFVQRIEGRSYTDIAESGGGIRVSVEAVRRASLDDLVEIARPRLARMLRRGVTTVEIKSGYGLTVEDEIKMLEAVALLGRSQPVETVGTYLAAHTTPREFAGRPDDYLDAMLDASVLKRIRERNLAAFCDVFCERTVFNVEQSRRVLTTAAKYGLRGKLHADQITQMGATRLAGEVSAVSADHLERIDDGGIAALKHGGCIAVVLPACSFFLGVDQAPVRSLIEVDLPVAVATDYNPGSSMIESLPMTMVIACTQARMTPVEVLVAVTANAAAALDRQDRIGSIQKGWQADLVVLDVPNPERWMYEGGRDCVRAVVKKGSVVYKRGDSG